jgi:hypothetical protein
MEKQSSANHGEGDPEAAERFNSAEQAFVESPRGKEKVREGAKVGPGEEAELAKAEDLGRARSKADDSNCLDEL